MDTSRRRLYRRLCYAGAVGLSALAFTPVVIPSGVYTPTVGGMPYTLWMGILITVGLVLLTFVATRVSPARDKDTERAITSKPEKDT